MASIPTKFLFFGRRGGGEGLRSRIWNMKTKFRHRRKWKVTTRIWFRSHKMNWRLCPCNINLNVLKIYCSLIFWSFRWIRFALQIRHQAIYNGRSGRIAIVKNTSIKGPQIKGAISLNDCGNQKWQSHQDLMHLKKWNLCWYDEGRADVGWW